MLMTGQHGKWWLAWDQEVLQPWLYGLFSLALAVVGSVERQVPIRGPVVFHLETRSRLQPGRSNGPRLCERSEDDSIHNPRMSRRFPKWQAMIEDMIGQLLKVLP